MNKSQRDYAIVRITTILKGKFRCNKKAPTKPNDQSCIEKLGIEYNAKAWNAESCASYIRDFHPAFEQYRMDLENHQKLIKNANLLVNIKLTAAKDFIMLGNNKEVLDFLNSFED